MVPAHFTAPGGIAYFSIAPSNPDLERYFNVRVSGSFQIGAQGLRELAAWLIAYADENDPSPQMTLPLDPPPPPPRRNKKSEQTEAASDAVS